MPPLYFGMDADLVCLVNFPNSTIKFSKKYHNFLENNFLPKEKVTYT